MGISRDTTHKRRATGGRMVALRKKRKFELGRQPSLTKLGAKRVRSVRVRGGHQKFRALRANDGNFSWGSEGLARKTRILDVVYNASNNELVRTKTLVKNAIIVIDATPFRQFYEARYGEKLGKGKKDEEEPKKSKAELAAQAKLREESPLEQGLRDQFNSGRLFACVSSRPGQSGRVDGYILEGDELAFYQKKMRSKRG